LSDRATGKPLQTLVVARYNEDLSWLNYLPYGWEPFVVHKEIDVPNEGREASSYLWALQRLSVAPTDVLAFCQGDPFEHSHHFFERLESCPTDRFTYLSDWIVEDDANGSPHHPRLPLGKAYERLIGGKPPKMFEFAAGAQFAIPGRLALKHTQSHYAALMDEANVDPGPWLLERLWKYIFKETNV
jgi:hypothetical protein